MSSKYSLWLCPPTASSAHSVLDTAIAELSASLGSPRFAPHVTLFSPIMASSNAEALKQTSAYVDQLRQLIKDGATGISVNIGDLATGSTFYQCVFFECTGSPDLFEANAIARKHWHIENRPPFRPHVSLLYENCPADKLACMKARVRSVLPADMPKLSFMASEIYVVKTTGPWFQWSCVGTVSIYPEQDIL
ncbi:LigT-like protein [Coemansia reversa NRRL 1564]|uniref:LigT-like protein n=1 Tax=Coemansia reversa (strain ATCC 12441 / NRRL 1564) TaxID=763665 RepID=A0A2G5BFV9_COERN|nr:LigT-like protein [Coemansia reversa NRRL 1564]|eukprot:PIA17607.1 LigT-like protein [Coemansia reversa NRRL 1564]